MTKKDLIEIIKDLKNSSHLPNDIAYRALRGKIEKELNIAIVEEINCRFKPPIFAKKGWKFIDAAVFKVKDIPLSLIEMKAHNSIDFPWWLISHYKGKDYPMIKDILKLLKFAQSNSDLYFIFFNNIYKSNEPYPLDPYGNLVCRTNQMIFSDKVLRVFKNWAFLLEQLKLPLSKTTAVEINAGISDNIPVSIIAFVYGPFTNENSYVLNSKACNLPVGATFHDPIFWEEPSDKKLLDEIKLDGIDFYYEDTVLGNLGNGVNCIPIKK